MPGWNGPRTLATKLHWWQNNLELMEQPPQRHEPQGPTSSYNRYVDLLIETGLPFRSEAVVDSGSSGAAAIERNNRGKENHRTAPG